MQDHHRRGGKLMVTKFGELPQRVHYCLRWWSMR